MATSFDPGIAKMLFGVSEGKSTPNCPKCSAVSFAPLSGTGRVVK